MKKNLFIVLTMLTVIVCLPESFVYAVPGSTSIAKTVASRFQDNQDGTITDTATDLIWVKDGSASGSKTWDNATAWCSNLASGTAGLSDGSAAGDWRLPGKNELLGLISGWTGNYASEWLDSQGFTNTQYVYWSSDTYPDSADYAWVVTFITGTDGGYLKTQQTYARAVRTASTTTTTTSVAPRFHDNNDGTITDTTTDLIWLKDGYAAGGKSWNDAKDWCSSLASGTAGLTDNSSAGAWRLPSKDELLGLISGWSWSSYSPAWWLDSQGFTNTHQDGYWISDSYMNLFILKGLNFKTGSVDTYYYAVKLPTRPVRAGGGNPSCAASKALGPDNPLLENLRAFRDGTLAQSAMGRRLIQLYYTHAGSINAALDRSPTLRSAVRRALEVIAPLVGRKEE